MTEEKLEIIDFSEKLKPFENMWVALSRDKSDVIFAEKNFKSTAKKNKERGFCKY